jgi:hypothetical protein
MSWYNPGDIFGKAANVAGDAVRGVEHAVGLGLGNSPTNVLNLAATGQGFQQSPMQLDANVVPATSSNTPGNAMAAGTGTGGGAAGGGGTTSGGTGTSGTPAPGTNANGGNANFTDLFNGAVGTLQNSYNNLFGNGQPGQGIYGQAAGQAAGNVQGNYANQQQQLGNSYAQSQNQLPWELVGRGAGSSSWADNNINAAQQNYNTSNQGIQTNEAKDLANIQQQEQGAASQYGTYLNPNNPGSFTNPQFLAMLNNAPSYIQSEDLSNVNNDAANLAYTQGVNTPMSTAIAQLQQNPSYQQAGSTNIQNILSALAGTPTTQAAQQQILQGIAGNPNNPSTPSNFTNYWQTLPQNQNQTQPAGS